MKYRRNTSKNEKIGSVGYAMFVIAEKETSIEHYGQIRLGYDGQGAVEIESIDIAAAWEADKADEFSACLCSLDAHDANLTGAEVATAFNPADIVNSAEAWDNPAIVAWAWERVFEPAGIVAVTTQEGAIVFDEELIAIV